MVIVVRSVILTLKRGEGEEGHFGPAAGKVVLFLPPPLPFLLYSAFFLLRSAVPLAPTPLYHGGFLCHSRLSHWSTEPQVGAGEAGG